jgi:PAS domain-containing protein
MLPRDASAVALARRAVEAGAAALDGEQLDVACLLVSELVTNAVRHGAGEQVELVLRMGEDRVRFEVHDAGSQRPILRAPAGADGGYGLNLVASLASRWGASPEAGVWFELDRPAPARSSLDGALAGQLATVLDGLAEAVTITAEGGRTVYANEAAVRLLRLGSAAELIDALPGDMMDRFDVFDETGAPVSLERLPGARVRAGERDVEPMLVRNVVKATGEERWLLNKTTAVVDDGGQVVRVVNVIEDVTEAKRAELGQRLLAQASDALAGSLDYEATLRRVAEVAVPGFADWCAVDLPDHARGVLQAVAVAHADPDKVALARRLRASYPVPLDEPRGVAAVVRSGSSLVIGEIADAELAAYARDAEHLALLQAIGLASVIVVPLAAGGETLGALTLARTAPGRVFDDADVLLAEELGRRAGTAVLNARMYTERATIAATLQRGLRPPELLVPPGFEIATHYTAAGELNEVGGDFYDAFATADGWMLVVGDVAGHGAEAAALTALARWTLRSTSQLTRDPARAAHQLNATLRELPQLSLCTTVCAHVRTGASNGQASVTLANCGHPRPLLVRGGRVVELGGVGPMAGAFDDGRWDCTEVALHAGDALVLYTDGVLDTVGAAERFGYERLRKTLETAAGEQPAALVTRLADELESFRRGPQRDDTAIAAVRFVGMEG